MFQWVKRYVEPSSTVDGRLIDEMRGLTALDEIKLRNIALGMLFLIPQF